MQIVLPPQLNTLILAFLGGAHRVLCQSHRAQVGPFIFMGHRGMPMEASQDLTHYWDYLLNIMEISRRFSPHK